jgi:hypothetical protein
VQDRHRGHQYARGPPRVRSRAGPCGLLVGVETGATVAYHANHQFYERTNMPRKRQQMTDEERVLQAVGAGYNTISGVARRTRLPKYRVEPVVARLLEAGTLLRREPEHSAIRVARMFGLI